MSPPHFLVSLLSFFFLHSNYLYMHVSRLSAWWNKDWLLWRWYFKHFCFCTSETYFPLYINAFTWRSFKDSTCLNQIRRILQIVIQSSSMDKNPRCQLNLVKTSSTLLLQCKINLIGAERNSNCIIYINATQQISTNQYLHTYHVHTNNKINNNIIIIF